MSSTVLVRLLLAVRTRCSTGNVTSDIFDSRVAFGLLAQAWNRLVEWLQANGVSLILKFVLFLMIVGIAKVLASIVERLVARSVASPSQKMPMLLRDIETTFSSAGTRSSSIPRRWVWLMTFLVRTRKCAKSAAILSVLARFTGSVKPDSSNCSATR